MSRRALWLFGLGILGLFVLAWFLAGRSSAAGASSLSRRGGGLLLARSYLEERGVETRLLGRALAAIDRPSESPEEETEGLDEVQRVRGGDASSDDPAAAPVQGVVVTAFPWSRLATDSGLEEMRRFVEAGGSLVIAYSGQEALTELRFFDHLGIFAKKVGEPLPLSFGAWRRASARSAELTSESASEASSGLPPTPLPQASAPRRIPQAPADAEILYRWPEGEPAVFLRDYGEGRLIFVPVTVWSNARLLAGGNADLLEEIRQRLGDRWVFDEYHQGLVEGVDERPSAVSRSFDLLLAHLGVLYLLGLWTLARRFGPSWQDPPVKTGSAASFLRGLGELHDELGHHRQAAELLVDRAGELDPGLEMGDLAERAREVGDERGLVALAKAVGARRRGDVWRGEDDER